MPTLLLAALLQAQAQPRWSITFGGDLMFEGISPKSKPLAALTSLFKSSTLTFANLESPLSDARPVTDRKTAADLKAHRQYILTGTPEFASQIRDSGIDFVTLANNHSMDHRWAGLKAEISSLNKFGVQWAGAGKNFHDASLMQMFHIGNLKIGVISALAFVTHKALWTCSPATSNSPGIMTMDIGGNVNTPWIKGWIQNSKKLVDVLIVGLHWGIERKKVPIPYQVSLAHALIQDGADVIYGCHPHVLEGAVLDNSHPILYSMGNLISGLPCSTGAITLYFQGSQYLRSKFTPISVRGGRASLMTGRAAESAKAEMIGLNRLAAAKGSDTPMTFTSG